MFEYTQNFRMPEHITINKQCQTEQGKSILLTLRKQKKNNPKVISESGIKSQ